jgi:hypothetical protein
MMRKTDFFVATNAGLFLCFVIFALPTPGSIAQTDQGTGQECQDDIDRSIAEYDERFKENMSRLRGYYKSLGSESSVSRRKELEKQRDALLQQMDQEAKAHEEGIGRQQQNCDAAQGSTTYQQCLTRLNNNRLLYTRSLETNMLRLRKYSRSIGNESSISKRKELEQERDALAQQIEQEKKAKAEEFDLELEKCEALRTSE